MNRKNFDKMISEFSKVYEKILTPDVLSIYFRVCNRIPDNQVNHIIQGCFEKCSFFPRPADIFSFYDEYALEKGEARTTSEEEIERSRQGIRKLREEFGDKKEPMKIGDIIKEMKGGKIDG